MMDEQYFHDFASEIYCCEETIDEIIVSLKQIALDARREALSVVEKLKAPDTKGDPAGIFNHAIGLAIEAISSLEVK
jgi:hypothetical protein